ncbi:MAG: ComF family protein [Candidatus Zixiibacteriota bacterium]
MRFEELAHAGRMVKSIAETAAAIPFPLVCPVCGSTRPSPESAVCAACQLALGYLQRAVCPHCRCYRPFSDSLCDACGDDSAPRAVSVAALLDTAWRDIVHALKYRGDRALARPLAALMAQTLPERLSVDVVVPVPTEERKRRERGYGHAELLAEHVAAIHELPVDSLVLERTRRTKDQTRLSGRDREMNLHGALRVRANRDMRKQSILLVDDVMTTGATLREASRALIEAGATSVLSVVLCLNLGIVADGMF